MKIEDWEYKKSLSGDERNRLTGYGIGDHANDRARNAENGVKMLIEEVKNLKQQVKELKSNR